MKSIKEFFDITAAMQHLNDKITDLAERLDQFEKDTNGKFIAVADLELIDDEYRMRSKSDQEGVTKSIDKRLQILEVIALQEVPEAYSRVKAAIDMLRPDQRISYEIQQLHTRLNKSFYKNHARIRNLLKGRKAEAE